MTALVQPSDLPARILAAIDETERIAKAAAKDSEPEWSPGHEYLSEHVHTAEYGSAVVCGPYGYLGWALRQHVALHDPAGALRHCDADRDLVQWYRTVTEPGAAIDARTVVEELLRKRAEAYGITTEETANG